MAAVTAFMISLGIGMSIVAPAGAINVFKESCSGSNAQTEVCKARNRDGINQLSQNVINVLLFAAGIVSVIMIIVGGIRYATSNGDQARITSAKNTVLYSVIGLIVTMLAFAIVYFVVRAF